MSTPKIAFITGANRGIGYSIAKHLIASGISVIGTYHANEGEAKAAEAALNNEDAKLRMLQLDIANHALFTDFAEQVKALLASEFGQQTLHYVVQNAGNIIHTRFDAATSEQLDNQYNIHFKGPYLLTVALLPLIRDGGRILNITSAATRFYLTDHGPYAAMKAATEVISLYMAKELGTRDITVNTVAPGAVASDFGGGLVRDDAEINKGLAEITPLGRVGQPNDIGAAVRALLSDDMHWVNGQRIEVTGGQSL
ncbi:SDR family NAD(P)-dependent oxidoreductase [Zymomonas mobilis]|uniref:Short-chain dehydrogenase/reductase SDR n=1 Tax=Zymomonas mobilis subsp. pomaceae (strain ATCC 29192 / DSM 22645 / JCM 10191 / CCUG 17912 / NBRC 13757 / NCIMB 11200 / NRRL B-4491 / Barker I) TaxID=579138 RepID=F8EW11_ZYMMT|nr:SDR family oxidoreductase [Zymomonas mobilis]AEI38421.1 short-chain dehydrogenase/reductase SDR [Zymomonas mobilis subsp. pomaceae ATCC 29192]MDX5948109.1 SDR family oxidoreductase [Zymomonas mobilis subsp. pomaceae]GEB89778.1 short-chain dehydrogenase [Zymomonas mobilis subsp. pomaceae]